MTAGVSELEQAQDSQELALLRTQRDYYRRRWLVHGIRYPYHLGFWRDKYVAAVMDCLAKAKEDDGS